MAKSKELRCELITPDHRVLDTPATAVVIPAHDGEVGILRSRSPLLHKLGIGICRITTSEGVKRYYVDGGFARVSDNQVTILTEHALSPEEVNLTDAQQKLAQARGRQAPSETDQLRRQADMRRAAIQIKLVDQKQV
jgi:F-type H+-transporting ATPase subunit epsilon